MIWYVVFIVLISAWVGYQVLYSRSQRVEDVLYASLHPFPVTLSPELLDDDYTATVRWLGNFFVSRYEEYRPRLKFIYHNPSSDPERSRSFSLTFHAMQQRQVIRALTAMQESGVEELPPEAVNVLNDHKIGMPQKSRVFWMSKSQVGLPRTTIFEVPSDGSEFSLRITVHPETGFAESWEGKFKELRSLG